MSNERMLVVDDEEYVLESVSRVLQQKGFETETANSPSAALEAMARFRPGIVLTDIKMPGMNGVDLARRIKQGYPDTCVVMMTAYASVDTAIESLKLGVDDYIKKPVCWEQAIASIQAALDRRFETLSNREYVETLERELMEAHREPSARLLNAVKTLSVAENASRNQLLDTVESLAAAIGARDPVTKDHSRKVGAYVAKMAEFLSFAGGEVRQFRLAGLLHDIGMIGIPGEILRKSPEAMTEEELEKYKEHPLISHRILQPVREFQPILGAVLHHHERFDGKGFPDQLSGPNIPVGARMIAVADSFSYIGAHDSPNELQRQAFAVEYLMSERGTRFDPKIVDALIKIMGVVYI